MINLHVITDEYTIFECVKNDGSNVRELIYCGRNVAEDFCKLIDCPLPSLFNPLCQNAGGGNGSQGGHTRVSQKPWNKARKQLRDCVLIMLVYFGNVESHPTLFTILREIEDEAYIDYYPKQLIKSVNTYLEHSGLTYAGILDDLATNNNIRNFQYDELVNYANKLGLTEHFSSN